MKRYFAFLLICTLFFSYVVPVGASAISNNPVPTGKLTFESIALGNSVLTIPVIIQTMDSQNSTARNIDPSLSKIQKATYYIPLSEEAQAYNNAYVQSAASPRSSGTSTDSYPDPKNYFTVTTYIRYTLYPSADNTVPDFLVKINNVAITRTADPVGMEWDILGVGTPNARIVQVGYTENGGTPSMDQVTECTVPWGSTGVNTPSSWVPVVSGKYSNGCRGLAEFTFIIHYATAGTVTCNFTHTLSK